MSVFTNMLNFLFFSVIASIGAAQGNGSDSQVLTVVLNEGREQAVLTRADLEVLPQTTIETTTIWTDGMQTFAGPTLRSVLESLDLFEPDSNIRAIAANGYFVDFEADDLGEDFPIIAVKRDGQYFELRENGPLWVVYPYDATREYRTEIIMSRSIWQVVQLDVTN